MAAKVKDKLTPEGKRFFEAIKEIAGGSFAPNSPATIKKKGSDKPLIDTGIMRSSVNYQIVEKGSMND